MAIELKRAQPSQHHRPGADRPRVDAMAHGSRVSSDMGRGVVAIEVGSAVTSSFVASKVRTDVA
jgi:hypothetical protein